MVQGPARTKKKHNTTLNKLRVLNKFTDAFSATVGITEELSSAKKTSMCAKEKRNTNTLDRTHKDVREGRPLR